ncbi:MAG: baaA1 [Parcubacteria group bacterium]|nr:baaA1 [Parcubacteria group bacterium]
MTSTNTTIAKLAALIAGFGIVAMSFAIAPVHAQTTTTTTTSTNASLQAQIAALQAQIAALIAAQGGAISVTFTRDLTIGSRGTDVTALQSWLIGKGFSIPAGPTGYFGVQTRAAVAAFQAANGITPTAGYFGPITRARVAALMGSSNTTTTTTTTGTGALQGTGGRLDSVSTLGDIQSSLNENTGDMKVAGISARAVGSDLAVDRVDVQFDLTGSSGSTNLNRYVQSVSIYQNGTKLATMNPADGSYQNKVWTLRFNNLNGVIRNGQTSNLYVEVTPVSSINSNEMNQNVKVTIPANGIRVSDSAGVSDTYPANSITQTFSVAPATTGKLIISQASDNPFATVVKGDVNNTTTNVTLEAFNLRANNQNLTVRSIPVGISVTGTSNVGDVVQSVSLMQGSNTISTKTVTGTGTSAQVVFDNVNQNLTSNNTQEYTVVATIRKMGSGTSGTAFDSNDTITASTSPSGSWDVSDSNGNTVAPTGSSIGGTVTFQTVGLTIAKVSATANKSLGTTVGSGDNTQYAITFTATAGDQDIYIDRSIQNTLTPSAAGAGTAWATTTSSTAGVTNAGTANLTAADTNSGDTATSYKVPAGSTRTFTLNVTLTATGTGFTGVQLTGINWDTVSNTNSSTNYYTAGLDQFKTADVSMTTH